MPEKSAVHTSLSRFFRLGPFRPAGSPRGCLAILGDFLFELFILSGLHPVAPLLLGLPGGKAALLNFDVPAVDGEGVVGHRV